MKTKNKLKKRAKTTGVFGSISGTGSVISAHNVCHALCLAVVAILSVFGIIVSSDILMFLENYNLLFWGMGMFFLALGLLLYSRYPGCMSKKLILANSGLLLIGIPFPALQQFNLLFWVLGSFVISISAIWYINGKIGGRKWLEKEIKNKKYSCTQ